MCCSCSVVVVVVAVVVVVVVVVVVKLQLGAKKWSEHLGVFTILTWKCASRHNGAHFFDISTSKSGPEVGVFCAF